MKKFIAEFKEFAMKGNVVDMAIGVVIGAAFGKITTSLVNDVIMPLISRITGGVDFSAWKWVLKAAEVDETGAETAAEIAVNYGSFIAVVLDFLIIALVLFMVVKAINKLRSIGKKEEPAEEEPAPTAEKLLTEIRDLLKENSDGSHTA
jgi:large conductance mechanosensitive channel